MHKMLAIVTLLFVSALPCATSLAQTGQEPPTANRVMEDFAPMRESWLAASGAWSVADGTYVSTARGIDDITTITWYRGVLAASEPTEQFDEPVFFARVRMLNQGTAAGHLVGLVYQYQDPQNYREAVVSALGTVRLRTVTNGMVVDDAAPVAMGIPRNTWFELELRRDNDVISLKVNGRAAFTDVSQPRTSGQIGLVSHSTVGRFDKLFVGSPFGEQSFLETFEQEPVMTFTPRTGQWTVANGTYNSAVQQTSVTLTSLRTGVDTGNGETIWYTVRARLVNPYGGSGNLVGFVFNYGFFGYNEVVFSPTGVAKMNRVENGAVHTLATASYNGRRNVPFDVTLANSPGGAIVIVDGERIFEETYEANPRGYPDGGVGLITHWAPGRFDNFSFDHGVFRPCSWTFADPLAPDLIKSGEWNVNGGTLNNSSVGASDIVDLRCQGNSVGDDEGTNAIYSARLLNQFGASGNLVGLVYNYHPDNFYAGDYFEVVFSPTGTMRINKVIQRVRYNVGTFSHNVPRNTWFDVQIIRSGIFTTVKVNGSTVADRVPQGELRGGSIGVVTHYSRGRFDDVSLVELLQPPSQ